MQLLEVLVAAADGKHALLRQRHHLGTAGDHEVVHPRHHAVGGEVGGGDPRTAEPVERDATGLDVITRIESGHAAEVARLLLDLGAGAPHDVVHIGGVEAVAFGQRLQHRGPHVLGVEVGETALAQLARPAGSAAGVDNEGVGHGFSSGRRSHHF
jgi:hypothetical protein